MGAERPAETFVVDGGCLCGAVRYRVEGAPSSVSICHCRSCRLASGAPIVSWFVVDREKFTLLSGKLSSIRSSTQVTRAFCQNCGTQLTYEHDDAPSKIELTTATLSDSAGFVPTKEIWVSHKLPWIMLNPSLKHFPEES